MVTLKPLRLTALTAVVTLVLGSAFPLAANAEPIQEIPSDGIIALEPHLPLDERDEQILDALELLAGVQTQE